MSRKNGSVSKLNSQYMKQYEAHVARERRRNNRLYRRLALFGLVVVLVFGFMTTYHLKQRQVYASKQEEYEQLQEEYKEQQQLQAEFEEELELLKDPEYVLEIARTNYFFSKEGEMIFKILDEDPSY